MLLEGAPGLPRRGARRQSSHCLGEESLMSDKRTGMKPKKVAAKPETTEVGAVPAKDAGRRTGR